MKAKILLSFIVITAILTYGCAAGKYNDNESIYLGKENYARFELPQNESECNLDSECFVGGCSGETCTAYESKITTCEIPKGMIGGLACRCISKKCMWVVK